MSGQSQEVLAISTSKSGRALYPHLVALFGKGIDSLTHKPFVEVTLRTSGASSGMHAARRNVLEDQLLLLETCLDFSQKDSLAGLVCLNGDTLINIRERFYLPRELFMMVLPAPQDSNNSLDGFSLSDHRRFSVPCAPRGLRIDNTDNKTTLLCDTFSGILPGEALETSRWQLFSLTDTLHPVMDDLTEDPVYRFKNPIPFFLNPGEYRFRVSWLNNFGNWSEWSKPCGFTLSAATTRLPVIDSLYLSSLGDSKPLNAVFPGKWYHLYVRTSKSEPQAKAGYLIVEMHKADYPYGHPGNKGGRFLPARNYVYNLSFDQNAIKYHLFEKTQDSSYKSDMIPPDSQGRYLDASFKEIVVDTQQGLIRLKVRVLEEALPGQWQMKAFFMGPRDDFFSKGREYLSFIKTTDLELLPVQQKSEKSRNGLLIALACALAAGGAFRFFSRRSAQTKESIAETPVNQPIERGWDLLLEYINKNIAENNLSATKIREDLKFSRNFYYEILKAKGITSLPNLVNSLKIKKAQELLKTTNKSITEISFEVGFSETAYFSKTFKAYTGQNPSEYRS